MTIQRAAYDLCKYVIRLRARPLLANLMERIDFSADGPNGQNYGDLGQLGRRNRSQFAGFLTAMEFLRSETGPQSVSPLSDEELGLLEGAHELIISINSRLFGIMDPQIHELVALINPYETYELVRKSPVVDGFEMPEEAVLNLCSEFANHPSLGIISESYSELTRPSTIENARAAVCHIVSRIHAVGCLNAPEELQTAQLISRQNPVNYTLHRGLMALVALGSSMIALDQLMYQAFRWNRLPLLDGDSIFHLNAGSNLVSEWIRILAVPTRATHMLEPLDMALVKITLGEHATDSLCQISSVTNSFSQETGHMMELHMRRIDSNLNCYKSPI
jgi:hypothetical protein